MSTKHHYCDTLGFDKQRLELWLALFELGPSDKPLCDALQRHIIAPNKDRIVDDFYDYLLQHREFARFIGSPERTEQLKHIQIDYLLSLGRDFDSLSYFEQRLRVGISHYRIGLPLSLYECAYCKLGDLICEYISLDNDQYDQRELQRLANKLLRMDMSLAIESYNSSQIQSLEATVDKLREEQDKLRHEASTDILTRFANREHALEVLNNGLAKARDSGTPMFVVMFDLDNFKEINDSHGHLIGDRVLRTVATRVRSSIRSFDTVGRYGGDELIIILEDTSPDTAHQIAERIRQGIAKSNISVEGNDIHVTVSQGIACARPDDTARSLIERADKAMYIAKQEGRNRIVTADTVAAG